MAKEKIVSAGGQAVIEGVMMRSGRYLAIAVRKPDGNITLRKEKIKSLSEKVRLLKLPFFRGILALFEMLVMGVKALSYSAGEAAEGDDEKATTFEIIFSLFLAVGFALLFFKYIPLVLTDLVSNQFEFIKSSSVIFSIIDGIIKIAMFIGYILIISYMEDMKRVFMFHGAEHKAVNCFEDGKALTVKNVKRYPTLHTRCGTSFILIVLVLGIFVYSFIPNSIPFWYKLLYRILLLPVIAGLSYEILKASKTIHKSRIFSIITWPGLLMQKLTTRNPDETQIKVAIAALNAVLEMERTGKVK